MSNLNDRFVREQNRIGEKIYKKTINNSVWNKLVPKETWPDGLSDSIQVLTIERNLPDDTDTWQDIAPNSNSNNCLPTVDTVHSGQTLRSYTLQQKALESEEICVNDTRNAFRTKEQIRLMYENLTRVVSYLWKRRSVLEYTRVSEHKMVARPGLPESSTHFPAQAATLTLNQSILNKIYVNLISDSAELDGGSLGMADGKPQFILVTDMESSDAIMREAGNVNSFLWNRQEVPKLLQPLGVERGFRGYYHTIDVVPRRFNFVNGAYVEVQAYDTAAATKGTKKVLSAAYRQATHTLSHVFLPSVMAFMVPQPISTIGSDTSFKPQSYMGDFKWLNIQHRTDNPDNSIGFYRALIQSGSKPIHPEFGYAIMHLRCPEDIGNTVCPSFTAHPSSLLGAGEDYFA
jgi:hypothetical protein